MIAFKIDNYEFSSDEVQLFDYEETADILNGKNSGRLQNGEMYIEPLATFFNHSFTIHRRKACSNKKWDDLYDILSDPNNEHTRCRSCLRISPQRCFARFDLDQRSSQNRISIGRLFSCQKRSSQ